MKFLKGVLLILALSLFFISCEQHKTTKEKMKGKVENAKETAGDVADDVKDGVKKTTKAIKKDLD